MFFGTTVTAVKQRGEICIVAVDQSVYALEYVKDLT